MAEVCHGVTEKVDKPYPECDRQRGSVRSAAAAVHQAMKLLPGPGKPETKKQQHIQIKRFEQRADTITPPPTPMPSMLTGDRELGKSGDVPGRLSSETAGSWHFRLALLKKSSFHYFLEDCQCPSTGVKGGQRSELKLSHAHKHFHLASAKFLPLLHWVQGTSSGNHTASLGLTLGKAKDPPALRLKA